MPALKTLTCRPRESGDPVNEDRWDRTRFTSLFIDYRMPAFAGMTVEGYRRPNSRSMSLSLSST
jgi:hypothetical protein